MSDESAEEEPLLDAEPSTSSSSSTSSWPTRSRSPFSMKALGLLCALLSLAVLPLLTLQLWTPSAVHASVSSIVCSRPPDPAAVRDAAAESAAVEPLNHCRLLSALARMRAGEALRLAAVGGSITRAGPPIRSWLEIATLRLNAAYPPKDSAQAPADPMASVRAAFHQQKWGGPASRHLSRNLAMGGIPSSFVSTCLSAFFPDRGLRGLDILFVEFAVNDLSYAGNVTAEQMRGNYFQAGEMTTGGQLGEFDPATNMERIIRYALAQSLAGVEGTRGRRVDGPAVVLVEFCVMDGLNAAAYHTHVAYHYGVPVISVCELLPFSYPVDEEAGVALRQGGMMRDDTHPTLPGHAVASAMITDRLLNQLLPQADNAAVMGRCAAWRTDSPADASAAEALSPPLFPINAAAAEYRCTVGQFVPGVTHDHIDTLQFPAFHAREQAGWTYQDETSRGKFGWSSAQVNATLVLALQPSTRVVILSYLRSYANIGSARCWLTGAPAFVSPALDLHAWWPRPFSTFELTQLPPSMAIPAGLEELSLHLQLLDVGAEVSQPPVQRPSNRFKLVGVFEQAAVP